MRIARYQFCREAQQSTDTISTVDKNSRVKWKCLLAPIQPKPTAFTSENNTKQAQDKGNASHVAARQEPE